MIKVLRGNTGQNKPNRYRTEVGTVQVPSMIPTNVGII